MKAKIFLTLSICCFLLSLGILLGLTLFQEEVWAQTQPSASQAILNALGNKVFSVRHVEDFMREHGKQMIFYHKKFYGVSGWLEIFTVPENKRLIITDFMANDSSYTVSTNEDADHCLFNAYYKLFPVVVEPGQSLYFRISYQEARILFTGYYVDL